MISVILVIALLAMFLAFSIFKPSPYVFIAVIVLSMAVTYVYHQSGYIGASWVDMGMICLIAYQLSNLARSKKREN